MATIDLAAESSESEAPPSPPPSRPSRPKLRTRRSIAYEDEEADENDEDEQLRRALEASRAESAAAARRSRARTAFASTSAPSDREDEEDDEEDEVEQEAERDGDYEQAEETADDDMDDFIDDDDDDEVVGRRRSSRARRTARRADTEDESDGGEFEIRVVPRRRGERSAPKQVTESASRKRKRPTPSRTTSASMSRAKARKPRQQEPPSDDEIKAQSTDSSPDENWLMSDNDDDVPVGRRRAAADDDDDVDENAFIVEKILAREVHTLKEWARLRQNKTTRFLTNASIFLDDEDEDGDAKAKTNKGDNGDVVVMVDGEPAQPDEERFLIKWKNLSYIHVSWETEKNLMEVDRNVKGKIQRFREKELLGLISDRMHGDEYFNPEFRDVDRILDIQDKPGDKYTPVDDEDDENGKPKLKYMLVKWKAQPYDMVTWEREDDVHDDAAVKEYEARLERAVEKYRRMTASKSTRNSSRKNPKFRGYSTANPPPFKKGQSYELRDYQLTGVNWMLFNWYQRRNSMLADEMGLGKTVQTVTYVNHLAVVEELPGPYLIVAPLSTLAHWQREFTNWTNLNAVVYHGSAEARKAIQDYEFFLTESDYRRANNETSSRTKLPKINGGTCYRFDVLITTYEMCSTPEFAKLARVKWQLLAVDEAHRLKNRNSKLSVLIHKNFNYANILLLTGTPLQNNVEELWTLLNFLDPDRFDSMEDFLSDYGELKDVSQVEKLHGELKPFLLRRMKEDVEKSLAPKEETIIEVELTVLQKQYYRAIFEQNTEFLARGMKRSHAPSLMNVLMELRKCCNHPFLIKGMEQREVTRIREQKDVDKEELERQATELLVTASGKLILLDKLLPRLKENGHRVLIFSQFKIMLDILQDYLRLRSYRCERIDGNITGNDRQAAIDRFCDPESQSFIMLLSTRAGGVGINLTAADTVIIYDSDWNPQNDLQAQARCHRIGQKKSVKIYRLLTAKTYELHMFHQASLKLGLDQAVLGSIRDREQQTSAIGKTKRPNAPMSKDEIENLLKHGAYEMFKEDKEGEAEAASKRFSEESIDQILNRSTKIIHDPKANADGDGADGKKSLMSSFSKATFVSSDNPDAQVALDDPDFWTKVIGLQAPEKVEPSPLKKRRCRREVKSYVQEESDDEAKTKKRGRGRPKKEDADFEEFVISSSDEEDDDDEDGTDDLDDDDFDSGKKPKKVVPKPSLPKIYIYHERISDLLTTFGYGRWDEMVARSDILSRYPTTAIASFSQELLASYLRVAATSYITAKSTPKPLVGENGQQLMAAPLATPPPTLQQINEWLDSFASRYRFVGAMLNDLKLSSVSSILVYSPGLARTASSVKSERDATNKLQQVDRMYTVNLFVRQHVGPVLPMMALLSDFQKLGDREKINRYIMDGVLPPRQPQALAKTKVTSTNSSTSAQGDASQTVDSVETDVTPAQVDSQSEDAVSGDSSARDQGETSDPKSAEVEGINESSGTAGGTAMSSNGEDSSEVQSKPGDSSSETAKGDETGGAQSKPGDSSLETKEGSTASETSGNGEKDSTSGINEDSTIATTSTSTKETTPLKPAQPTQPPTPTTPKLKEVHLRGALVRLQTLPDIGGAPLVAPWWISIVDDVLLLLYVHTHGWMKSRMLPNSLVEDETLFGPRASAVEFEMWPTVPVLNRRVKALLVAWTNVKRLAAQASAIRARELLKIPKPTRNLAPPSVPSGMNPPTMTGPMSLSAPPPAQPDSGKRIYAQLGGDDATQLAFALKRQRFAKLVFQYGIPETRHCRSPEEREEKWRFFTQDSTLDVGRFPLSELLAEATDLERWARVRLTLHGDALPPPLDPPSRSILGSKRGIWALTPLQCRRLIQRIDLFKVLRKEVLRLPSRELVRIVNRVIEDIQHEKKESIADFPMWWSCPRHDILLLQGVELYGLDQGLGDMWKRPFFAKASPSGIFPSSMWVENYVIEVTNRAHRLIRRILDVRAHRDKAVTEVESEARQRLRDIQGMKMEDPQMVPRIRRRMEQDSREYAAVQVVPQAAVSVLTQHEPADEASREEIGAGARELLNSIRETRLMKQEDPLHSIRARDVWLQQRREDAATAVTVTTSKPAMSAETTNTATQAESMEAPTSNAKNSADVIELVDDDADDDDDKGDKEQAQTDSASSPSTEEAAASETKTAVANRTEDVSPKKDTTSGNESDNASTSASARAGSVESSPQLTSAGQKRKRAPRPWEVIVIDDSDEENISNPAPAKRTTRSRRLRRGENLSDGL